MPGTPKTRTDVLRILFHLRYLTLLQPAPSNWAQALKEDRAACRLEGKLASISEYATMASSFVPGAKGGAELHQGVSAPVPDGYTDTGQVTQDGKRILKDPDGNLVKES